MIKKNFNNLTPNSSSSSSLLVVRYDYNKNIVFTSCGNSFSYYSNNNKYPIPFIDTVTILNKKTKTVVINTTTTDEKLDRLKNVFQNSLIPIEIAFDDEKDEE